VLARKAAPILITLSDKWAWAQANLPVEVLVMCWGLTLCFFGGTFSLTLCAYEAFKISGWDTSRAAIEDLNKELVRYRSASIEDDKLDEVREIGGKRRLEGRSATGNDNEYRRHFD
jgi:hypothetical protein